MSSISKAFILGAGLGTRLRPLTDVLPKPLVPLHHDPLASHAMRHCLSAGIKEFAINTHHLPQCWSETYPDGTFAGASLQFFHEPVLLETGGGIKNIAAFIEDEPLLVYNGDILTNIDLPGLMEAHSRAKNLATLALFSTGPNCNVALQGDRVVDMRHARGIHAGTHQFTGIYVIEPEILNLIPEAEKISIVPAFLQLAERGELGAFIADGASWHDLGTRDEYLAAHAYLRQIQRAHLVDENGFQAIHPAAKIHPSASVDSATCFIGPHCVIDKNVKLRNTIVWPGAHVTSGSQLDGCIVRKFASGNHHGQDL